MNKKEKKEFLSMDLIERVIRLEQRVSASFGEFIPYSKTKYFKSLPKKERIHFIRYLKKYKRRKYILVFLFSLFVTIGIFFRGNLTGRVISDNLSLLNNIFGIIFLIFLLLIIFVFIFILLLKNKKEKRMKGYFDIIDKLYLKK